MEKKKNKFQYLCVLQEWVEDYGWADSCFYDINDKEQMKEMKEELKYFRAEGIRVQTIRRRVPNDGRIMGI